MHLTLEVKRYHEFFWLRDIRGVDISKCCAECFLGGKDNRVYYGTLHKPTALVDIDVIEHPKAVAYYLCGLSAGFNYWQNTHTLRSFLLRARRFLWTTTTSGSRLRMRGASSSRITSRTRRGFTPAGREPAATGSSQTTSTMEC